MSPEKRYLEELIQDIKDHGGIGDMNVEQALKEAHERRQSFAREMAQGLTNRSKMARQAISSSCWVRIRLTNNNQMAINHFANRCFEIAG